MLYAYVMAINAIRVPKRRWFVAAAISIGILLFVADCGNGSGPHP